MRYRRLTTDGDYQFGHGGADYLVDSAALVAQSVKTRLLLMQGEWFLDVTEGTPYSTEILGTGTQSLYDLAIQTRVLETEGVAQNGISDYSSSLVERDLTVSMTLNTIFGAVPVEVIF